jgi:hypothetical protein
VQTNYDNWLNPPFYDDRMGPAVTCLNKWGQKNPKNTLFNVLSTRPVLNKVKGMGNGVTYLKHKASQLATHYQVLRRPDSRESDLFRST